MEAVAVPRIRIPPRISRRVGISPKSTRAPRMAYTGSSPERTPAVRAFTDRGWVWGGSWHNPIDYQHFEKP